MSSGEGVVGTVADYLGVPAPAFRLLLSLIFGYPLAAIYHKYIYNLQTNLIHYFFASTGFLICIFNYGFDVYHSFITIFVTYVLCHLLIKTKYLSIVNFIFQMGYLLAGYYFTASNDYDIKWTMPHCVLSLRLIGFGFDVSDGQKPTDELSKDQKETALNVIPSFLELTAFAYFPASFLIGPQFPFCRYKKFINKEFTHFNGNVKTGLQRCGIGLFYLIVRQIGASIIYDAYLESNDFNNLSFIRKILYVGMWGKISLYKYISCWLITEGSLMIFGLTYNGKNKETGEDDWYGCSNVHLKIFEMATAMEHYVHSFNVNTNQWLAQYVYKRLKFLNNRTISYGSALFFLAVWHGLHSGYYMSFFLEYLVVTFEKQFTGIYKKYFAPKYSNFFDSTAGQIISFIIFKFYNVFCMGWCLIPFVYLTYDRYMPILRSVNFYGYIALGIWFGGYFSFKKFNASKINRKELNDDNQLSTNKNNDKKLKSQ